MKNLYSVQLTEVEQHHLRALTQKGETKARKLRRAHVLLLAHRGRADEEIQTILSVSPSTVHRIRQRFAEEGLEAALNEKPRSGGPRKLDAYGEALLVATACSTPPDGRECWTMQLLADRLMELKVVETLSDEAVRRTLKKTTQAVVEGAVVHSHRFRRVCLCDGGGARRLCLGVSPGRTARLFR